MLSLCLQIYHTYTITYCLISDKKSTFLTGYYHHLGDTVSFLISKTVGIWKLNSHERNIFREFIFTLNTPMCFQNLWHSRTMIVLQSLEYVISKNTNHRKILDQKEIYLINMINIWTFATGEKCEFLFSIKYHQSFNVRAVNENTTQMPFERRLNNRGKK